MVRTFLYGSEIGGEFLPSIPALYGGPGSGGMRGMFRIDFGIDARTIDRVSAIDVVRGLVDGNRVAGKRIIIGASAIELRDYFLVPRWGLVSGHVLQALGAETLLQRRVPVASSPTITACGLALFVLCAVLVRGRAKWHLTLGGICMAAIAIEGAATLLLASSALLLETSAWQIMLLGWAAVTLGGEICGR
jgi:CHASE2 domain-containing sensor protein